jgi:hypothetical protein
MTVLNDRDGEVVREAGARESEREGRYTKRVI